MYYKKEESLQYVWQRGLFEQSYLVSSCGKRIEIIEPGVLNSNSGPDFKFAKIKIDHVLHVGHVELHLKSSDWLRHGHQHDSNYRNVILHVVQENDLLPAGDWLDSLPCLELGALLKVDEQKIRRMMQFQSPKGFHCYSLWDESEIDLREIFQNWKWDLILERMDRKADLFFEALKICRGDLNKWVYESFASQIGYPLNQFPMEQLSSDLPFEVFKHYLNDQDTLDALFLGQAGLLGVAGCDEYELRLIERYHFLSRKHSLTPINKDLWQYFRLRPYAFPDRRIAYLSAFASKIPFSSSVISSLSSKAGLDAFLDISLSAHWKGRYRIGKPLKKQLSNTLGLGLKKQLLVNMVVPMLIAYGRFVGNKKIAKDAYRFLATSSSESNNICASFNILGLKFDSALESQAAVELKKRYCQQFRCLECQFGKNLLNIS
jgi:hypothetical protein